MPITKRIVGAAAAGASKRVATSGPVAGTPATYGTSCWGDAWGDCWGKAWTSVHPGTAATPAAPAMDVTQRISEAPTGTTLSVRIGHLLLLEGGESGYPLLEGATRRRSSEHASALVL